MTPPAGDGESTVRPDPFVRSMLRWFAALASVDRAPATLVALGDSLVHLGSINPAVDVLFRHLNPVAPDPVVTGYGWVGGCDLEGGGRVRRRGGFDGAPRALVAGESCWAARYFTTGATVHGIGPVEVVVNDEAPVAAVLGVAAPLVVPDDGFIAGLNRVEIRATGDAEVHGVFLDAGNRARGLRYYQVGNPGKTCRYFLDDTDAPAHLAAIRPDLLLLEMALNDVTLEGAARFVDDLGTLFATCRAAVPGMSIVYWFPHRGAPLGADEWATARDGARRVCEDEDVVFLDGHRFFGATGGDEDSEHITNDGVHLSEVGRRLLSMSLLATIAPGLEMSGRVLTSTQLGAGQIHAGTGTGQALPVAAPPAGFSVLHGGAPNLITPTGLFFSEATYLSAIEPPAPPPPGSAAVFARTNDRGHVEVCVRFPDGSVHVLAAEG